MILTENQRAEIKQAITSALERVYTDDLSLIEREAHERSIAFRFGLYFTEAVTQTSFGEDDELTIDFDYNRNQDNVKNMDGFNPIHGVLPDIILHHRGHNDKNVVVIEFKGYWSGNGNDHEKLCGFTHQELNDYQYGLGVFIRLEKSMGECVMIYYRNGGIE